MNVLLLLFAFNALAGRDDLYEILHVSRSASTKEIKSAYRREATKWY